MREPNDLFYDTHSYIEVKTLKGDLITSGRIVGQKRTIGFPPIEIGNWSSTDNHYFFNVSSDKLRFHVTQEPLSYIPVQVSLLKELKVEDWMQYHKWYVPTFKEEMFPLVDVFTDRGLDEADIEIRDFLYFLNRIPGVQTSSSCCGHKKGHMYISFEIDTGNRAEKALETLQRFTYIIAQLQLEDLIYLQMDTMRTLRSIITPSFLRLQFYSVREGNEEVWKALKRIQTLWEEMFS